MKSNNLVSRYLPLYNRRFCFVFFSVKEMAEIIKREREGVKEGVRGEKIERKVRDKESERTLYI